MDIICECSVKSRSSPFHCFDPETSCNFEMFEIRQLNVEAGTFVE